MLQSFSNYLSEVTRGKKIRLGGKTAQWKKVNELTPGMMIAAPKEEVMAKWLNGQMAEEDTQQFNHLTIEQSNNDIFFDEIVSIKHVGREQVWDIEIEGTHNFVGNGILAHNTYISGNLGIGTTSPSALLHLGIGSTAVVGQKIVLASGATANAFEVNSSAGTGGDKFVIQANGNVGIGTTAPTALLDLNSAATTTNIANITASALTTGKALNLASTTNNFTSGGLINASLTQAAATGTAVSGDIVNLSFAPTYSTNITTPALTGQVLDVSRSVTTNTDFASTLTLSGALATFSDSATQTQGTLTSTADVVQILQNYSSNTGAVLNITSAGTTGGYALRVNDNGTLTDTTPFVVDNSGNVGIGTTSPGYLLQVGNAGDGSEARANAWNSLSDIRFKENVTPIDRALAKILMLDGISFNWKASGNAGLGLSAQDVAKVFPELVSTDEQGVLSLNYGGLTGPIISAIKEQEMKLDALGSQGKAEQNSLDMTILGKLMAQGAVEIAGPANFKAETLFEKLVSFLDEVVFKGNVSFASQATFLEKVLFSQAPTFNEDTAGFAIVPKGQRQVKVSFKQAYAETPVVTANLLWDTDEGTLSLMNELQGYFVPAASFAIAGLSSQGFTLVLDEPAVTDLKFSWIALAVQNAQTTIGETAAPTATPTATPTIELSSTPTATLSPAPTAELSSATPTPEPTATPTSEPTVTPAPSPRESP
ncbi:hypothetical protein FJZ40_00590 [Candidatus Shapirobacteria bacterium]|nr:hypothetical protein [Candidatus Shapirobacteria bacterium]